MLCLREALAASWDKLTAYLAVEQVGNPALGQCYPTSWVLPHYYPDVEIVKGTVWAGESTEIHFWNALRVGDDLSHIDLTWEQFPTGSYVQAFQVVDRQTLDDSEATVQRQSLLLQRVAEYLKSCSHHCESSAD